MRYIPKGWEVTISRIVSYMFLAGISSCLLLYGIGMSFSIIERSSLASLLPATFFYLLIIIGMAILTIYNLWRFPDILVSAEGIDLKVFFYHMHIDWQSILRIQKKNNKMLIFFGGKRLLLNRLYGLFDARVWDQPVVLFAANKAMVDRLADDIKLHLVSKENKV